MNFGQWNKTDLANIFRKTLNSSGTGTVSFYDFKPYPPSYDAPASFISKPVVDGNGTIVGVLAIKLPIGCINGIMQKQEGMGESGGTYIVREHR